MNKTINPFVYQRLLEGDMPNSTIPGWLCESYAQAYEDVIIESLIKAYGRKVNRPISLSYVEIGANHPVCTNSTYLWQRKYGVNGILVEANPKLIPALQKYRPNDKIINAAATDQEIESVDFYISPDNEISSLDERFVNAWKNLGVQEKITVPTIRVNTLLEAVKQVELVVLIVDVEGLDLRILKDIDFDQYRPFIIEVEPSDGFAPGTGNAMVEFLASKGYNLVSETDVNLIFQDSKK
jgi:FkbM family methyltransferase